MASTRKLRSVNKRYAKVSEEWPDKDAGVGTSQRNKTRKRKLSDMLGPQWNKEELERFYEVYRKYGKDWKKVSSSLRNRSPDMAEALYNLNRAYLSLPEGTATAAGLTAMMTDHYNILEGSNSDRESNDSPKATQKTPKRGRAKVRQASKTSSNRLQQFNLSSFGCLSLLKSKQSGDLFAGDGPRAVGKRTPRVPVAQMYHRDDRDELVLASKRVNLGTHAVHDEGAHDAALALAEVHKRTGSPQISQTLGKSADHAGFSSLKSGDKKHADSNVDGSKFQALQEDIAYMEGSIGSRPDEAPKLGKTQNAAFVADDNYDDMREACSGTEEGHSGMKTKGEGETEALEGTSAWGSTAKKRSHQLFLGDEIPDFDALNTLADLSLNILQPSSAIESESSAPTKDENQDRESDEKHHIPDSMPSYHPTEKFRNVGKKDTRQSETIGADMITRKKAKLAKDHPHAGNALPERKVENCLCCTNTSKRKRKGLAAKIAKDEANMDTWRTNTNNAEGYFEEHKPYCKGKRTSQPSPISRQPKSKTMENNLSGRTVPNLTGSNPDIITADHADLQSKKKSRRKMGFPKKMSPESRPSESTKDYQHDRYWYSVSDYVDRQKRLSHGLSSRLLRRWSKFEWFYSAIDYPWFAQSEFVEYLNHVKFGHVPRLTRVEWGVIRSSLGKPRRLSKQFLKEEREKLAQYRESVRMHYAELRSGAREGLPTDLARPLTVPQRVVACHPKTRELHDGNVLTVDHNRYRVQFDRPELGVEFVPDIDCMPLHPEENFPESLRKRKNLTGKTGFAQYGKFFTTGETTRPNQSISTSIKQTKEDKLVQGKATNEVSAATPQVSSQPYTISQIQEREADVNALAGLSRVLDKKEALLRELKHMNDEASGKQNDGETIKEFEHFKKQYAMLLVQLREANEQVGAALISLRNRNTYNAHPVNSLTRQTENVGTYPNNADLSGLFMNQDPSSQVVDIIETSRRRASVMVDAAIKAVGKLTEGEDPFAKIGEALDNITTRNSGSGSSILGIRRIPPDSGQVNSPFQDAPTYRIRPAPTANGSTTPNSSDNEVKHPIELIASCVATLLMVQSCSERQYPPAEVTQVLDFAVSSLQALCPQNLPILREIETCMGVIKNQMLALIPTASNGPTPL